MAYLRHQEAHEHLRDKVVEGIKSYFPDGKLEGRKQGLHLEKIEVGEPLNPDDIRAQHEAKVTGGTWSVPVHATLSLKDNASGKTIDTRRVKVAEIPHITSRYSYIVGGQEYRVDNQWQLKHGVYARRQPNGQLESKFTVGGRSSFSINLNPKTKQFTTEYNDAKIPLYPMMQAMGVSDAQLEKTWGKEILEANKSARNVAGALQAFGKTSRKKEGVDPADHLRTVMSESMLVPEGTEITLGKRFSHVTGETLHLATKKLLQVHNGHPEDDRDSLVFKNLRSAGDFAKDALTYGKKEIMPKINRKIDRATTVRDVVKSSTFGTPITKVFAGSQLSNYASQVNPAEMLSVAQQTTVLGEHGISSDRMVTAEAKVINSSHFGFLDPVSTPEGSSTGIALRLASAVLKVGTEAVLPLHNIKTGKVDYVSPATVLKSKVVLPDQVRWEGNKPVPVSASVKMMGPGNDPAAGKFKDADYVMRRSTHLMNITTNLIPFANNTNGARLGYGSRHMEQSISLLHREKPMVQAGTGLTGTMDTFDKLVGGTASHRSPISGTISKVDAKGIHITDHAGKSQEVQLYDNYPLNDTKSVYHSEALVKPGDKVSAGQVIADTNFSRDGVLALGTHLRTAYVPYKGLNFEDGVVISESAAKKLSSQHLYKHELKVRLDTVLDPKKFRVQHVGVYTNDQLAPIGDDGVVKVGTKVGPGDPLVLAMSPYKVKDRMDTRSLHKSLSGAHTDSSVKWDGDHVGEVVGVHRSGDKILVHVRTTEGMQVGDKTSTRHGGKGIVTAVLPDHEMPHTKDGKPMELLFNPQGLPGRMNVGQLLEVMAGKIAHKTGKTYVVQNFSPDSHDVLDKVSKELKHHGLSDTEELIDPESKKSLGQVTTGPLYTFKLLHQVDKKLSVRPGMTLPGLTSEADYSPTTMQPRGGGHEGGQAIGALGVYAMLAHGARANLREMQTFKSEGPSMQTNPAKAWPSQHAAVWAAIQTGTPLPTPRPTFAFKKFENMLRAAGINMDKHGHEMVLSPLTDKQILEMSRGELKDPTKIVKAALNKNGEPIPEHGGIFDERLTGGHGGNSWSHIALAEPIPNPVFEDPIKKVLGINGPVYESIVFGKKAVDKSGKVVELGHGTTGGAGIKLLLDKIHVPTELKAVESALKKAPASKVDGLLKRVKYLRSLDQLGMKSPSEAYILHHVPVLPPSNRPLAVLPDGNIKYDDLNGLYRKFSQVNQQLKDPTLNKYLTDAKKENLRESYYDGVRALFGAHVTYDANKEKGLLNLIHGSQPKKGFFQDVLVSRRQDLSMRSTIVPDPSLSMDEVGLPRHAALQLFAPFVVKEIVNHGGAANALDAQKRLSASIKGKKDNLVDTVLLKVLEERPALVKRDPVLHKGGIHGVKVRPVEGNAIKIHPLLTGPLNADFDGDTMSAFVPVSAEAVREARAMFPSKNLFSDASGGLIYTPSKEMVTGVYKLGTAGKKTSHSYKTSADVIDALHSGKIGHTDVVSIGGKDSTAGRALIAHHFPDAMKETVLHSLDKPLTSKGISFLLTSVAKDHAGEFARTADGLKNLGNSASYGVVHRPSDKSPIGIGASTLNLNDFRADKVSRDNALAIAHTKIKAVAASSKTQEEKEHLALGLWEDAGKKMREDHLAKSARNPNNLYVMHMSGVKPGMDQYKQLALAPMLMKDSRGRTVPSPVTTSYGEGLDVSNYWTHLHGTRMGTVKKVQEVQDPGSLTKSLQQTTMGIHVTSDDCGTSRGIAMPVGSREIHDRYLQQDFVSGNTHIPAGTLLTPDVVGKMRATDKGAQIVVRSPMRCDNDTGICSKCAGMVADGTHAAIGHPAGIIAAHSLGERATQLTLKHFHTAGVTGSGAMVTNLDKLLDLTYLPQKISDEATIAMRSGTVDKVEKDKLGVKVWIGGVMHHVGKDRFGHALDTTHPDTPSVEFQGKPWTPPKIGMHVDAGHPLSDPSRTTVNPRQYFAATKSIDKLQNHLATELHKLYASEGVKRKHIEVVVRAMTNVTEIAAPGDSDLLRGSTHSVGMVNKLNAGLKNKIVHTPVVKGVDVLPHEALEDWMAKLQHDHLRGTIMEGAATSSRSNLHGQHPIPGLAYGAEFGLTRTHSLQPGRGHLADVPEHHY